MPKEQGDNTHETRNTRSRLLAGVLVISLFLNGWVGYKLVYVSSIHVKAKIRIKELETIVIERQDFSTKLEEAKDYLKQCMSPGHR